MACRVLNPLPSLTIARRAAAILLLLVVGHASAQHALVCTGALPDGDSLREQASEFATYKLLRQRMGPPSSCVVAQSDSRQSIVFAFPRGGSFTMSNDTVLESSYQEVVVPRSAKLTWNKAVAVLRATERHAAAPEGCGVAWSDMKYRRDTGADDAVAEGTSCNCKARVGSERGQVVRMGFSLAC